MISPENKDNTGIGTCIVDVAHSATSRAGLDGTTTLATTFLALLLSPY